MRIKRQGKEKAKLSITKADWIRIGEEAKWPIPAEMLDSETPVADPFRIEVKKYGDRTWAVYVNGELLCVTVYKKGAFAVESILGEMAQRIQEAEGKIQFSMPEDVAVA